MQEISKHQILFPAFLCHSCFHNSVPDSEPYSLRHPSLHPVLCSVAYRMRYYLLYFLTLTYFHLLFYVMIIVCHHPKESIPESTRYDSLPFIPTAPSVLEPVRNSVLFDKNLWLPHCDSVPHDTVPHNSMTSRNDCRRLHLLSAV